MKAKRRTLILLLVLIALAGAALALLNSLHKKEEAAASEAEEGTIRLSNFAADSLTRIEYSYQGETVVLDYDGSYWTLADDPAYHLDQTKCDTMAAALTDLRAKRRLDAQTGEDYGIGAPLVAVTVTAAGETQTFLFGDTNTVTGDIYLQKEGDEAVYTASASKVSCFEYSKEELFGAFNPAGITSSRLEQIDYTCMSGEESFTVSLKAVSAPADAGTEDDSDGADDSAAYTTVWRLADDSETALDEEAVNEILSALGGYVSGQITGANPSDYGFDAPAVQVTASEEEQTYRLTYAVGTEGCYLMVEGDDSIYQVDMTVLEAFAHTAEELKAAA